MDLIQQNVAVLSLDVQKYAAEFQLFVYHFRLRKSGPVFLGVQWKVDNLDSFQISPAIVGQTANIC